MALNVIHLSGDATLDVRTISSDGTVSPGMLVEVKSDGKVKKQATAAVDCELLVAKENTAFNKAYTDAYATGDQAHVFYPARGAKLYVLLKSGGTAVVAGDGIESAGGGYCRKLASGVRLFTAEEAQDPTSADKYCKATAK